MALRLDRVEELMDVVKSTFIEETNLYRGNENDDSTAAGGGCYSANVIHRNVFVIWAFRQLC